MAWVWIYVAAWAVTSAVAFMASRRLGDRTRPVIDSFMLSVLAGALWPFLVVGVAELSSVAAYSTAETWLVTPDPEGLLRDVEVTIC
jgi:hypothetical protein